MLKDQLSVEIEKAMLKEQFALRQQLNQLDMSLPDKVQKWQEKLAASQKLRAARRLDFQTTYPETLPIHEKIEALKVAILGHQVLVVAGETGSGKSTQLPKICMDLGLGQGAYIGHTQPRRIAARTLATRIAEELTQDIARFGMQTFNAATSNAASNSSSMVGCKIRFSDSVSDFTQIKLMTDGMLLAEIQNDRFLEQYQCIIIDEAHERSLNIDFLLAYLKRLLQKRKDLKLIITSATIDVQKISRHFQDAPIIEICGRNYPVEICYQYESDEEHDNADSEDSDNSQYSVLERDVIKAVDSLLERKCSPLAQDILIFLSTENEIRELSLVLRKLFSGKVDILPLYGRLPLAQQNNIFKSHSGGRRRIVLSTNVAETSVTVPNIGFVIDSGKARISRYNARNKIQQLPVEKISQASANQRSGRCGRIAPGVCLRLYSESDFDKRPDYTEPEIQRTNLASVVLKLESLGLGHIENFPLLDKPQQRFISDAYKLLFELKAINEQQKLTADGRLMAFLPVDPRFSKMLLAARSFHCMQEVLVIVSALSVSDPRERPHDKKQEADNKHKRFAYPRSDFLGFYKLWSILQNQKERLTNKQFSKWCEQNFLSQQRVREWQEVYRQLGLALRESGVSWRNTVINSVSNQASGDRGEDAETSGDIFYEQLDNYCDEHYVPIHQALLAGLLTHVARLDDHYAYSGTNNRKLFIFPASVLMNKKGNKQAKWLLAAQLLETSKLYAHYCAEIEPEWIEQQGKHLCQSKIFEPFWSKKRGCVQAYEQVSLGGLVVIAKRAIKAPVDAQGEALRIFIQYGLIAQEYINPPTVIKANWSEIESLHILEEKLRRVDLLPGDEFLFDFYAHKIPLTISSTRDFESWLKTIDPQSLRLTREYLLQNPVIDDFVQLFPDARQINNIVLPCEYVFDPSADADGVNLNIRYQQLNQIQQADLDWLVPGLLEEKCEALVKTLPKNLRKQCLPVQQTVQSCLAAIKFGQGSLLENLAIQLRRQTGAQISVGDFQIDKLPGHLLATLNVLDENGKLIVSGHNLLLLKQQLKTFLARQVQEQVLTPDKNLLANISNDNIAKGKQKYTQWDFGDLEVEKYFTRNARDTGEQYQIRLFAALVDEEDGVSIQYFDSIDVAHNQSALGQRRLIILALSNLKRDLKKQFQNLKPAALKLFSAGDANKLFEDLFVALVDATFFIARTDHFADRKITLLTRQKDFLDLIERHKADLFPKAKQMIEQLNEIADKVYQLRLMLAQPASELRKRHHQMVENHLQRLIFPAFLQEISPLLLQRYPRYLQGMISRLDRLQGNIDKDQVLQNQLEFYWSCYQKAGQHLQQEHDAVVAIKLNRFRWMVEEFVLSNFVQGQKTAQPVSARLLEQMIADLRV